MTEVMAEQVAQLAPPKTLGKKIASGLLKTLKIMMYIAIFISFSVLISKLATVHGKQIPAEYFVDGYPTILGLLDSEIFMGVIFVITLSIFVYVLWLLWELHEVAVHKAQEISSQQIQLVFALSLCGLFIHKAWWVVAIIIAFTRWDLLAQRISEIISNGRKGDKK
ncbi:MAG: magnesium transporter [Psychromonas sp.]